MSKKDKKPKAEFPYKERPTPSIWDKNVDTDKLWELEPEERARMFPNDFAPGGEPYGDF